jgi:hypothetical protein
MPEGSVRIHGDGIWKSFQFVHVAVCPLTSSGAAKARHTTKSAEHLLSAAITKHSTSEKSIAHVMSEKPGWLLALAYSSESEQLGIRGTQNELWIGRQIGR